MNPSSKGWLKEYYKYFREEKTVSQEPDTEDSIYIILRDSSLLFSIPQESSNSLHPDFKKWNFKEKLRIVFANALFLISKSYIQKNKFVVETEEVYSRFSKLFENEPNPEKAIENLIDGKKNSVFLNTYNSNPWAFISLIQFYYFLEGDSKFNLYQSKFDIIKGMILASRSNKNISKKEFRLLYWYIENGKFTQEDNNRLNIYFDTNITSFESNFSNSPKLIRRITYDLALRALLTDYKIDESELDFINHYALELDIPLQEQYATFSLIQSIHLNHHKSLPYIHKTYSLISIKNIVSHNFKYVLKKNSGMIVNEIRESKELVLLIRKSTDQKLNKEEKTIVKEQILDLLKTIPSLTIFMIPGGSILLPIIVKILPKDLLFPSSFVNKNSDD